MAKKTITKEHPLTAFRKANEVKKTVTKKTVTKKALPKAQAGKIVKPTADSTTYYSNKATYLTDRGVKQSKIKDWDGMNRDFNSANKAIDSQIRQSNKGRLGYDKNGFPIKKTQSKKKG